LPPAANGGRGEGGRGEPAGLRLRGEDEPLRDAREAADRGAAVARALLLADRAARRLGEARAGAVAAAGELSPERRAPRGDARSPAGWPPLLRVPPRKLVRPRGLRAPALARSGSRDRRRAAPALPDP